MNESGVPSLMLKTCRNGEKCLHPNGPTLPLSEFYSQRAMKDGHMNICKECKKAYTRQRDIAVPHQKARDVPGNTGEELVIDKLRSVGIYAAPGKCSEFQFADVVAWGCVRIEVKSSKDYAGVFMFGLGQDRKHPFWESDLIVLVCVGSVETTYHVFPAQHPAFFRTVGEPKKGVTYLVNPKQRKGKHPILSAALMEKHRDNWQLVAEALKEKVRQLKLKGHIEPVHLSPIPVQQTSNT